MTTDNEWIGWTGGKCPVLFNTKVQVRMRDGATEKVRPAGYWMRCDDDRCYWTHEPSDHNNDIIAYRVVQS